MSWSQSFNAGGAGAYLLFRFFDELYGAPLSSLREVVPFRKPRTLLNTTRHYLGITSLHGEMVGVIDLRIWLASEKECERAAAPRALVVVESSAGVVGVAVDRIEGVCRFESHEIETNTVIPMGLLGQGVIGIGRSRLGLATLLELKMLCSALNVSADGHGRVAI